jgi:predicted nucleic acid-binding protein
VPSAVSTAPVVADASPLIALDHLGQLDLLHQLFATVLVPPAVAQEASMRRTLPDFISVRALAQPVGAQVLAASLGPGERERQSASPSRRVPGG